MRHHSCSAEDEEDTNDSAVLGPMWEYQVRSLEHLELTAKTPQLPGGLVCGLGFRVFFECDWSRHCGTPGVVPPKGLGSKGFFAT